MESNIETHGEQIARPDLARIVLRNSIAITIGEWVARVLNFAFTIYAVRLLGEAGWGHYATVVAFVGLFGVFFELGMAQYVQRSIAQDRSKAQALFWNMVALRLILASVGIIVITAIAAIIGYEQSVVVGVFLFTCTFIFAAFLGPLTTVLTASERFDLATALQLVAQIINSLLGILFLQLGAGFLGLVYTGFVVMPIQILLTIWAIRRFKMGAWRFHLDIATWPAFIRACLPFGLSSVALTYSFNVDTVILGLFQSASTVGWYNAAYRLVFTLTSLAAGFYRAITPSLSRENTSNPERVRKWTRAGIQGLAFVSLPVAVGGSLLGGRIVELLYGAAYAPAGPVLALIIWDVPFHMFNAFCGNITTAVGLERPTSRIYVLSTLIGIVLYFALIPTYGMMAAASITVLTDALIAIQFLFLLRTHMELGRAIQNIAFTMLAAALMGGVVWLASPFELPVIVGGGIVTYWVCALLFGLVDWRLLLSLSRRLTSRSNV